MKVSAFQFSCSAILTFFVGKLTAKNRTSNVGSVVNFPVLLRSLFLVQQVSIQTEPSYIYVSGGSVALVTQNWEFIFQNLTFHFGFMYHQVHHVKCQYCYNLASFYPHTTELEGITPQIEFSHNGGKVQADFPGGNGMILIRRNT